MESFLLGVDDRLLQVALRDERGSEGAVLTLVGGSHRLRWLPVKAPAPPPPEVPREGQTAFPSLPQGLTEERRGIVEQLVLDTSELPGAELCFSAERFVEKAARQARATETIVRLTPHDAEAWGLEFVADER